MVEQKTEWKKPELIVLTRSNPEEAVLATCKGNNIVTSPNGKTGKCRKGPTTCDTIGKS